MFSSLIWAVIVEHLADAPLGFAGEQHSHRHRIGADPISYDDARFKALFTIDAGEVVEFARVNAVCIIWLPVL